MFIVRYRTIPKGELDVSTISRELFRCIGECGAPKPQLTVNNRTDVTVKFSHHVKKAPKEVIF